MNEIVSYLRKEPFHRVNVTLRRLFGLDANLPGGDCYHLAVNYHTKASFGKPLFCKYSNGDTHTVLEIADGYIDFSSKNFFVSKDSPYYFKKFSPYTYDMRDYWLPRSSSLDKMFTAGIFCGDSYVRFIGNKVTGFGETYIVTDTKELIQMINHYTGLDVEILSYLGKNLEGYYNYQEGLFL